MNNSIVDQAGELFRRYDLIMGMNSLKSSAMVDMYIGPSGFCPIRPANSTKIKIDYQSGPGDLPRAHGPDQDVIELLWGEYGQREIEAPYWRGKFSIDERTLVEMGVPGIERNQRARIGFGAITDRLTAARKITDSRMAQTAVNALYGSIDLYYQDGKKITLDYAHAPQLRLDLTSSGESRNVWTNYADATPIDDIAEMKQRLYEFGANDPAVMLMGGNVYRNLLQCEQYKDYVVTTREAVQITANLKLPTSRFCDLIPMVASGTYPLIDRLGADYTSGTSVTLENGEDGTYSELTGNDSLVFGYSSDTTNNEAQELAQVTSIAGKTLTLDTALTKDYKAGDQIVWNRPYVGWDDIFILPMANAGEWMHWSVAQSLHANFQSSRYAVVDKVGSSIPAKYEVLFGVDGIPVFVLKNQHAYVRTAA